jgi:serine/threonine protein kinase
MESAEANEWPKSLTFMLAPETILQDRYRVVRLLGQGGMGAVYEAVDQRLDKTVALKETLFTEERLRKQFEREARLLARLHHPALPGVSDHFAEGDGEFLVMQYIAGDDLSSMMARRAGPFPPEQVVMWADQLLDALDYLHTQDPQIIHRDIKPQNLKIAARSQIVLLDFGLAKGQVTGLSQVTTAVSIFGYTPNYAPLEQVQGLGTDPRSDLYALAATLYHLLTGIKPPDALTRAASLVNGQPDPLQNAHEVNPTIDADIADVLQRAMSQNRDQRYASAAEMRKVMESAGEARTMISNAEASTILLSTAPTAVRAGRPTQKVTVAQPGRVPALPAPPASPTPPKKRNGAMLIGAAAVVILGLGFGAFYAFQHFKGGSPATPPASSPTPPVMANANVEPTNDPTKERKAGGVETPARREPAARKPEKPSAPTATPTAKGTPAPAAGPTSPPKVVPPARPQATPMSPPTTNTPEDPEGRRGPNGRRRLPNAGGTVKTFPDGTRVVVTPNGTRVVTFPDGTTRIFRPGERINRRP